MTEKRKNQTLPMGKRALGWILMVVVSVVGLVVGLWVSGFFAWGGTEPPTADRADLPYFVVVVFMFVLGCLALGAGVGGYFLVLKTHCFTFDFSRPFLPSLKKKLYLANIFVLLLLLAGPASFVSMVLTPILHRAGLSLALSFVVPALGTFLLLQLLAIWLRIWSPLEKAMITRRLAACGISAEQMQAGLYVGISDPAKSSFKKLTMVEDDCGMLWILPEALSYRGDADHFYVRRDQMIAMERKADAGSLAAYGGTADVVVRFRHEDDAERVVRFHTQGCWTLSGGARATDALAEALERWQAGGPAGQVSRRTDRGHCCCL